VISMLTRTIAHYPNSGHDLSTLAVVAEDWYETFKDRLTEEAFIAALTKARRDSKFFPIESDIIRAASSTIVPDCERCNYFIRETCKGGKAKCTSFQTKSDL